MLSLERRRARHRKGCAAKSPGWAGHSHGAPSTIIHGIDDTALGGPVSLRKFGGRSHDPDRKIRFADLRLQGIDKSFITEWLLQEARGSGSQRVSADIFGSQCALFVNAFSTHLCDLLIVIDLSPRNAAKT